MSYPIPDHWEETEDLCENCDKPTLGYGINVDFPILFCPKCYRKLEGKEPELGVLGGSRSVVGVEA